MAQWNVKSFKLWQLGSPSMAGPFVSAIKNSIGVQYSLLVRATVSLILPRWGIPVPLYAVRWVPGQGVRFFKWWSSGNSRWYWLSGRMFPWAPVSTFARIFLSGFDLMVISAYTSDFSTVPMVSDWNRISSSSTSTAFTDFFFCRGFWNFLLRESLLLSFFFFRQ